MEIYFIQHCQLILQDSRLITIVPNQCTLLVSSPGKDGIVLTDLGSWWNTGKCWSCWWWWWGSSYLIFYSVEFESDLVTGSCLFLQWQNWHETLSETFIRWGESSELRKGGEGGGWWQIEDQLHQDSLPSLLQGPSTKPDSANNLVQGDTTDTTIYYPRLYCIQSEKKHYKSIYLFFVILHIIHSLIFSTRLVSTNDKFVQ